jgi:hypothetical protein
MLPSPGAFHVSGEITPDGIILSNGYSSGQQQLLGGNVTIHK